MSNQLLQQQIQESGGKHHLSVFIPPRELTWCWWMMDRVCTDNAIMIAWRGQQLFEQGRNIIPYDQVDRVRYNDKLDFDLYSNDRVCCVCLRKRF